MIFYIVTEEFPASVYPSAVRVLHLDLGLRSCYPPGSDYRLQIFHLFCLSLKQQGEREKVQSTASTVK